MKKINAQTTLGEILKIEGVNKILEDFQVPCLSCPFRQLEMNRLRLVDICNLYGIDQKKLLEAINNLIQERSGKKSQKDGKDTHQKK